MKIKLIVVVLAALHFGVYWYTGYLEKASLLFTGVYIATLVGAVYILSKINMKLLLLFSGLAIALGACVEYVNTQSGNWVYFTGSQVPVFVVVGWIFLLALIVYSAKVITPYIHVNIPSVYPSLVCFGLFFLFSIIEKNITWLTLVVYIIMAFAGVYGSLYNTFGWNTALILAGIVVGSISESLGASCGLWTFKSGGILPLPMVVAWSVNALAFVGLLKIFRVKTKELFTE
jgi:hypothetical protein